jgi:IS5 family transposase
MQETGGVAAPVTRPKGGQFVLHISALHGNPFEGHPLAGSIADIEQNTSIDIKRAHVDRGYRGDNHPNKYRLCIPCQVRRTTLAIKRKTKRRAAVEPSSVI